MKFYKIIIFMINCFVCFLLWLFMFNPILSTLVNIEEVYMPDVLGEYKSDALKLLNKNKFNVSVKMIDYSNGCIPFTVHDIYPKPYTKVKKGRNVELVVFSDRRKIKMPSYIGLDIREAKNSIRLDRLSIDERNIFYYFDEQDSIGHVSRQLPEKGEHVIEGDSVSLWVCNGRPPNEYVIPDVVGKSLKYAIGELKKRGFLVGEIKKIDNNNFLEDTVYELSYISANGYNIEVIEGIKYTAPIKIDITVTKYGE